jgi:hypothetical protein
VLILEAIFIIPLGPGFNTRPQQSIRGYYNPIEHIQDATDGGALCGGGIGGFPGCGTEIGSVTANA